MERSLPVDYGHYGLKAGAGFLCLPLPLPHSTHHQLLYAIHSNAVPLQARDGDCGDSDSDPEDRKDLTGQPLCHSGAPAYPQHRSHLHGPPG